MRYAPLLVLIFLLSSCCLTKPPAARIEPAPKPVVTWQMALEWAWGDAAAEVRAGMADWNRACGRELLREAHGAAVTVHHKGMAVEEAALVSFLTGGTVLGLADRDARVFYLYPQAFQDEWTLRNTTTHEMGHVLGLNHDDTQVKSVMHSGTSDLQSLDEIAPSDIRALNSLGYQCPNVQ